MKSRILVAVVGVPVLVWVALYAPSIVLMLALCVLAGIGGHELYCCVGGEKPFLKIWSLLYPAVLVALYAAAPGLATAWMFLGILVSFGYAVFQGGAVKFNELMTLTFGGCFIGWSFSAFLRLLEWGTHRAYLLLPFILSFACDTFAFFAGKALGKHKLAPKVSPNKTVEGSIGGMLGNIVCGLLFAFVMDHFFEAGIGYGAMALLAFLCSIVAQLGDLSFSLIKREFGIKDYGHLFLAHGGVLDRFDSVLFVTPVVELVLHFVN